MAASSPEAITPARGQVWHSEQAFPGESADFLVISCDDWNQRRVYNVLGLEIAPGHGNESGRFAPLIMVGDQPMTVYGDVIVSVPKDGLVDRRIELDDKAMVEVDRVLDLALTPSVAMPGPMVLLMALNDLGQSCSPIFPTWWRWSA